MKPCPIRRVLEEYLSPVPEGLESKVEVYLELLERWSRKIPLTSIRDPEQVVRFHFGESVRGLALREMKSGRLADVGTGAGFPGLVLKLTRPGLDVLLIEPNKRKCAFLCEVIRELQIDDAEVISTGFRESGMERDSLDFVTCRALGDHAATCSWAASTLRLDGSALFWVGYKEADDLRVCDRFAWREKSLIPSTKRRFIVVGDKVR